MPHRKLYGQNDWRADVVAAVGEFLGTATFLFFGLSGIQAARDAAEAQGAAGSNSDDEATAQAVVPDPAFLLMASTSMAMALVFSIWIFFRVTGAAFNPQALTLVLLRVITPLRFVLYVVAQLLGGLAAGGLLQGLLPNKLNVNCSPAPGLSVPQALFYEMFLTFGLASVVVMVAVEKNRSTFLAPLAIGFALFSTQLAGIQYTGGAVNTARAFGSAVASRDFSGSHWLYWVGPTLGAILAAGLHKAMHAVHYWELNPGSDATSAAEAEKATRDLHGDGARV